MPFVKLEDLDQQSNIQIIPGTEKVKDPFTGEQKKQAGFAVRMENAIAQLEALENSGFNPVNAYDIIVSNLPLVPDAKERYFNTPKFKQYQRAKIDFSTSKKGRFGCYERTGWQGIRANQRKCAKKRWSRW